jgi:hypothetical protein
VRGRGLIGQGDGVAVGALREAARVTRAGW